MGKGVRSCRCAPRRDFWTGNAAVVALGELTPLIARSIEIKASVVRQDEREGGIRKGERVAVYGASGDVVGPRPTLRTGSLLDDERAALSEVALETVERQRRVRAGIPCRHRQPDRGR